MDFYRPGAGRSFSAQDIIHRGFPFHVGYDAFRDASGSRATDIGADTPTNEIFKGWAIAEEFTVVTGSGFGAARVRKDGSYGVRVDADAGN